MRSRYGREANLAELDSFMDTTISCVAVGGSLIAPLAIILAFSFIMRIVKRRHLFASTVGATRPLRRAYPGQTATYSWSKKTHCSNATLPAQWTVVHTWYTSPPTRGIVSLLPQSTKTSCRPPSMKATSTSAIGI